MRHFKYYLVFVIVFFLLILFIANVNSFSGSSASYNVNSKVGYFSHANSTSTSFIQRVVASIGVVAQYISNLFSGRFGILTTGVSVSYFNVSTCANLSTSNSIYFLNISVASAGTCFNITATNVTLNCNGFTVNYSRTTTGYGIFSNGYNQSTITNCIVYQGSTSRTNSYAFYLNNGVNVTISNNTIATIGTANANRQNHGIFLNNLKSCTINNNNISTSTGTSYGILVNLNSNSVNISGNFINTIAQNSHGVYLYRSNLSTIYGNRMNLSGNGVYGSLLYTSNNNNISSNNISLFGTSSYAVYMTIGSKSNLINTNNLTGYGSSFIGVYDLNGGLNHRILNNNINGLAGSSYGVYFSVGVNDSVIDSNRINLSGFSSQTIRIITSSIRNNITNNNLSLNATGGTGILLFSNANSNNIINNTIYATSSSLNIGTSASNFIYNNYLNGSGVSITNAASSANRFNTSKTPGTNIIAGQNIGGNFWANLGGTGFSQLCPDVNNDGICDTNFTINSFNVDYLSLTLLDSISPNVDIYSPVNNSFVNGQVVIRSNASDNTFVTNVLFQYMNSTVNWTNLPGCNITASPYNCNWNTAGFSNSSLGYLVRAIAFDGHKNNATSQVKSYTIDRTKPIIYDMSVIYPTGQSSIRTGQNLTLSALVTDSPDVAAGVSYVQANLASLNSSGWVNMTFSSGSTLALQNSTWNLNVTISSAQTGIKYANITVFDAAQPTNNNRTGDLWAVTLDNTAPTNDTLFATDSVFNNSVATFSVMAHDNFNLSRFIFSSNLSGVWVNDTPVAISGLIYQIDYSKVVYTGNYSYRFFIYDDAGNVRDTGNAGIQVLGNAPFPFVYSITPVDGAVNTSQAINFLYSYTNGTMDNCSLYLNSGLNLTSSSPTADSVLNFSTNLADGIYNWYISCTQVEANGAENVSVNYLSNNNLLTIDSTPPIISVDSPLNVTYNVSSINFNASLSEDGNCLYSLNSGANVSMTPVNSSYFSNLYSGLTKGSYSIVFNCNDSAGNFNNTQPLYFSVAFPVTSINITSPINNQEVVRGDEGVSGEDDLGLISDYLNVSARVYDISTLNGIQQAQCYFYDNTTFIGTSATNSSGDCIVNYTKIGQSVGVKNISVNYSIFSSNTYTVSGNVSEINISLARYNMTLTQTNLRSNGKYYDGDNATLLIDISKSNQTGNFVYDPVNISANASNSAGAVRGADYYPGSISKLANGEYQASVTVVYGTGSDSFIKWNVLSSDNGFSSLLNSALHSDQQICKGDFGAWGTCSSGSQSRTDSSGCTEFKSCSTTPPGGGGGCLSTGFGAWGDWGVCTNGQQTRTRTDNCGETQTDMRVCNCVVDWSCSLWSLCSAGMQNRTCNDLNQCGTSDGKPVESQTCIGSLQVDYTPQQTSLKVANNSVIPFAVNVRDSVSEPLTIKWFFNSKLEKQDSGVNSVQSLYSGKFTSDSSVSAEVSNGLQTQRIDWSVSVLSENLCKENWYCDWGVCQNNGFRYSTLCTDLNKCGTNVNYPSSQTCSCIPQFQCGDWSACTANYNVADIIRGTTILSGIQSRTCSDVKGCENNTVQYQKCNAAVPVVIKNVTKCYENYIEVYDAKSGKLVGRVKGDNINKNGKLNIDIVQSSSGGYCSFCYDGVKNFDETGIDCGGPNCKACVDKGTYFDYVYYINMLLWIVIVILSSYFVYRYRDEIFSDIGKVEEKVSIKVKERAKERVKEKVARRNIFRISINKLLSLVRFIKIDIKIHGIKTRVRTFREKRVAKKSIRHIEKRISKGQISSGEVDDLMRKLRQWEQKGYYNTTHLQKKLDEFRGRNPLKK